jgi:hypothetical protein
MPSRDALMPPRLEDGLRDGRAVGWVPRDRGDRGRAPARDSSSGRGSGWRLGSGTRGAAARRVRTLSAATLSDTGVRENARSPADLYG